MAREQRRRQGLVEAVVGVVERDVLLLVHALELGPEQAELWVGQPIGDSVIREYGELENAIREKNIIVAVLAVPPEEAQRVADDVSAAGVKIIFNYTEALLHAPGDVTVHTTSPAVELLYALYFHLT